MTKPKTSPVKNERRSYLTSVSLALRYHGNAETAFRQGAMYAALCGLELQHLKHEAGHGKWLDFCQENFGDRLSDRLAQKYMAVAEGLKLKAQRAADGEITFAPPKAELAAFLGKHPAQIAAGRRVQLTGHFERRYSAGTWALLQTPAHRLDDAQRARLAAAVESIADGETMASLIEAYRVSKRPAGSGVEGGYRPDAGKLAEFTGAYHQELTGKSYEAMPAPVQDHFRKWAAQRVNDPAQLAFDFLTPVFNAFEHPDFGDSVQKLPLAEKQRMLDHAEALVRQLRADIRLAGRSAA